MDMVIMMKNDNNASGGFSNQHYTPVSFQNGSSPYHVAGQYSYGNQAPQIPSPPPKRKSLFDKLAEWMDRFFFASHFSPTAEKAMIIAVVTNLLGLHRERIIP